MKLAFIHAMVVEKAPFRIARMCRVLGVTRQGYYAYRSRLDDPRIIEEAALQARIARIHRASHQTYGSPRVLRALREEGVRVGKHRVERTMRAAGIVGLPRGRSIATTRPNPAHPVEPNVLARDFTASKPNQRWVTDITYVWTDEGWGYVAAILDLYSRAVVGWHLSATLGTDLPLAALDKALLRRSPEAGLLHHSDRGCQYTSALYRKALAEQGITVSMSRRGNCWDNAVAESFFATLKAELINRRRWKTRLELRTALFEYIDGFYNTRRLHSSIGYRTPAQAEAQAA